MKDRVAGAPGQYKATVTGAEFNKLQSGEPFAINLKRDDKPEVEGTPYSKAAVLPDDLANKLCPMIGDPTPADALKSLTYDLGDKAEVFGFEIPGYDEKDSYISSSGETKQKDGCYIYRITKDELSGAAGKQITIRTYMYGDMSMIGDGGLLDAYYPTNEKANIEQEPKSGIFETTGTVPESLGDGDESLYISFAENPYLDKPMIFEKRGSVWQEIKYLENNTGNGEGGGGTVDNRKLDAHIANKNNPHKVTCEQIGAVTQEYFDAMVPNIASDEINMRIPTIVESVIAALPVYNGEVVE